MDFLILTGLVVGVATLASYLTFITIRDYYPEGNRLGSLCPHSPASLDIASTSSFEKFLRIRQLLWRVPAMKLQKIILQRRHS